MKKIKEQDLSELFGINQQKDRVLVLRNDNVNHFDFVISSLVKVCEHTNEQAAQCALIAHSCGSCDIKQGEFDYLVLLRDALRSRGLRVYIQ